VLAVILGVVGFHFPGLLHHVRGIRLKRHVFQLSGGIVWGRQGAGFLLGGVGFGRLEAFFAHMPSPFLC